MQLANQPSKLILPFADAGGKNSIPVDSQIGITAGAASLTDGFPPLTRTNIEAGGIPPSGLDMNGILYMLSAIDRWNNAGAGYTYDATFATDADVNGYPKGARVLRSDGEGYWLNLVDNNTTNPESSGTNWVPDFAAGVAAITLAGSNVTLTPLQFGRPIIVLTGTLSANVNVIVPALQKTWCVINNTTGSYSVTVKTPSGTGVAVGSGASMVTGDGTNVLGATYRPVVTDMTAYAGADVPMLVGDKFSYTLSGTNSLPLRIATGNNQVYKLYWAGGASGGPSTNTWTFSINNTTYAGTIYWLTTYGNSNSGTQVVSGLTQGLMTVAIAGDLKTFEGTLFTQTNAKRGIVTNAKCGGVAGANYIVNSTFESTDTTTAWTSLGTLSSADSMVGTLIVERIA